MPPKAPKQKKDDSFRDFVLDALHGLPDLRSKAMFGGLGLSMGENFFGIVWNGRLYFKVDEQSRIEYASRGAKPFTYSRDGKKMTMSYYEVLRNFSRTTSACALGPSARPRRSAGRRSGDARGTLGLKED